MTARCSSGSLRDGAFEIAQFQALALVRRPGQHRLGLAEPDRRALAHRAAHLVDVLVVEDREQPSPQIGSLLPQMQLAERPRQTILHQIVRRRDIARQCASVAPQPRDLGLDALIDIAHENASQLIADRAQRPIGMADFIGGL